MKVNSETLFKSKPENFIVHGNWHFLYQNIIQYKLCINWWLSSSHHIQSHNFFSDSDIFLKTQLFFTHTTGRWTACSCPNYSVNTNSILPYFAIFTFFCLTNSHTDSVLSHTLFWEENPGFLKGLFATKIWGSICWVYSIWLFMSQQKHIFFGGFSRRSHADHMVNN
jgi:hypothetical protein